MGRTKARPNVATDDLKRLAQIFNRSGMGVPAIREILNSLSLVGARGVSEDSIRRWTNAKPHVEKTELITATYDDVMFLREKAYWATGMCEVNRMYITERAYWWGLYISSLHILLRQALAIEAAAELPPQFIMPQLEQFYEDIRTFRQMTPLLAGEEEESVEELKARMKEFERKWAKDLKLPKETL